MGQMLILIVDDEAYVTTVVGAQLRRRGHEVIVASDGQEALALAQQHRPDLVISDFQMPVLSGLEMSKQMRNDPLLSAVPIMLLTARGHRVPPSDLTQTNVQAVMAKPFSIKELMGKVDELMGGSSQNGESTTTREVA